MSFVTSDRSIFHGNMSSLAPSSANILLTQAVAFHTKKSNVLSRRSILRNVGKQIIPTSIRLFPQLRIGCVLKAKQRTLTVSASGTDVAVEEADLSSADSEASASATDAPEISGESAVASSTSSIKVKRSRTARKSDMPPVKNEELIPGATFTGKVRTIQPFGAFVDFGAFTDGLVHVSQLSDSYVKDVATVVTVGQEVTVRLVEANLETGRISLTMRSGEDTGKAQKQKESTGASDKSRPPRRTGQNSNQRRDETKKFSKFVKGQDLQGTVKNLTRAGAFISLPEGEEGFLPTSEESDEGFISMMGGSSFEVGQEVSVRVLRISRGQVTLTMKKDEAGGELDAKLNQGVVHTATNPFVLAFRTNQAIAAFLDEREKETKQEGKTAEEIAKDTDDTAASITDETSSTALDKEEDLGNIPEESETKDDEVKDIEEVQASSVLIGDDGNPPTEDQVTEESPLTEAKENSGDNVSAEVADISSEIVEDTKESVVDDATVEDELPGEPVSGELIDEASPDVKEEEKSDTVDNITTEDVEKNDTQDKEVTAVISSSESESSDGSSTETDSVVLEGESTEIPVENVSDTQDTKESVVDDAIIEDELPGEPVSGELTDEASPDVTEEETSKTADDITTEVEEKDDIQDKEVTAVISSSESESSDGSSAETDSVVLEAESTESPVVKNVNDNLGVDIAVNGVEKQTSADTQPNGNAATSNGQSSNASPKETAAKAVVSPALVKQLREETGAGMMDCKRALSETGGDLEKAYEYLRKKGLASADKKSSRATAEGRIGSYIHDSRIGVLIEVNCETDFVARGDIFKELVEDLAMQVAACPQVQYLTPDDVPQEFVDKEREIEMQKEDLQTKPEQFRSKIVDGRIRKRLEELALLEQPFIKDDKVVVKDWVKQTIATIGENIKVKRFVRYNLGEGLEKKSQDFAAEVAAQTAVKPVSKSVNQEPAVAETKETVNEPPKPVVSAALVKQLREETGAGMMDCKKALSETGGDLEKAHEYLRKKGLAAADKKSSRLAAEGRIGSYIHDSRIGVLIEVNCETDFVGRSENFKALVDDLAMQVVACPQVQSVSIEDVPENVVIKEKELEMQREDLQSKPENIREKIVEGRVTKRLGELALLEQPYIKNDTILVKDLVKQTVAALGENIKVRRFVRFTLGEAKDVEVEDQA